MSTDKQTQVLKLALEALEETLRTLDDENAKPGGAISDTIWYSEHETLFDYLTTQITAIREALAEQPAQQQEPVAWLSRDDARLALWDAINKREFGNPTDDKLILDHLRKNGLWIGKYTSPPASKPWVGLTEEERDYIWHTVGNSDAHGDVDGWSGRNVMDAIEAKLKEKNGF